MKHFLISILSCACLIMLLSFSACDQTGSSSSDAPKAGDGYYIKGQVDNVRKDTKVFLDLVDGKKVNVIDTAAVAEDGSFEMKGRVDGKHIARLRVGAGRTAIMLIVENQPLEIKADFRDLMNYEISGSPESQQVQTLIQAIQARQATPDYLKNYIDTVQSPLIAYLAVNYLKIEDEYKAFQKLSERLNKEMPNSTLATDFNNYVNSMKGVMQTAVGSAAPDLQLESPEGKMIPLSSLKGNVVLIDFWASWCRPCRRENPNVVKAYNKYKNKGFDVYSVSLDRSKEKWEKAIEQDGLIWNSHVSDLGGWKSAAAALYSVKSIPQTFLLDKNGKIVAKNLRGAALESKLEELLGA